MSSATSHNRAKFVSAKDVEKTVEELNSQGYRVISLAIEPDRVIEPTRTRDGVHINGGVLILGERIVDGEQARP